MRNDLNTLDDRDLVSIVRESNQEAFGILFNRYKQSIKAYAITFSKDESLSQDIVQDTFIRAFRFINIHKDIAIDNVKAWLNKIAHNLLIDNYRKSTNLIKSLNSSDKFNYQGSVFISDDVSPDLKLELSDYCKKLLENLKPEQKEIITLKLFRGLSFKQIAIFYGEKKYDDYIRAKYKSRYYHAINSIKLGLNNRTTVTRHKKYKYAL